MVDYHVISHTDGYSLHIQDLAKYFFYCKFSIVVISPKEE